MVGIAALAMAVGVAGAQPPRPAATTSIQEAALGQTVPVDPLITVGTLPNGLRYYIRANKQPQARAELRLVVNAGSLLENEDQLGLAHFMEHMNFNGLKHFPKNELVSYLESLGLKFGAHLNASTTLDATTYIMWLATDKNKTIDKAFTILEDWNYNALLDEDEVVKERGVILEESRLGQNAQNRMQNKYYPELVSHTRYADRDPIGKDSLIHAYHADALRKFYSTWYRPDLSAVIVAGDINSDFIQKKIQPMPSCQIFIQTLHLA
jgi:zinc protease